MEAWSLSKEEIFQELGVLQSGLDDQEAEHRLKKYGENTFHDKEKAKIFTLFSKQFLSPLIFLLVGASVVTSILKEWTNTAVILFAVILNVALGFYHEYQAENTLKKLKGYIKEKARVIRQGREIEIDSRYLVQGDIIKLSYGSRVPSDARLIDVNNFSVDESILTGESLPVAKDIKIYPIASLVAERGNIVHSGTLVIQGYATAVVFATGNDTELGKIAGIVSHIERAETPLKKGVNNLAWLIFGIVLVIVNIILILGISRGEELLPMLVLSVAVAVGAVPEALPVVLSVILAIGSTRIAKKKGIVKKLSAAETLGSTTLIMTDKTGTLTEANMKLLGAYTREELFSGNVMQKSSDNFNEEEKKLLALSLHNLDISIEDQYIGKEKWVFRGRPFETNIAKACLLNDVPLDSLISLPSSLILPFNSTRKFSVSLYKDKYIFMGAPDILLKKSRISKDEYLKIESWIENVSQDGKRLIGLATIEKNFLKNADVNISPENFLDLNFAGIFVFYDPLRPEIPASIKNIENHGIRVVLVTGDLKGTAISLAREIGWNIKEDEVLTGADLQVFTDEELFALLPKIKIFARVTPEDKLRIGVLYQSLGEVVAMTGDGVNDAPALKAMDIGVSLGSGSDVAKSAADLVLLDDNFKTISLAIDEGRRILFNIRKAIVYLLSNSLDEIFVIGGSLLFGLSLPLSALQIIWVNLFTGSLPALAFAFDDDMDGGNYKGKSLKLIFSREVKILCFGVGVLSSILLFLLYFGLHKIGINEHIARSVFFVCFSSYILVIAFSFKNLHKSIFSYNPFSNKKLNWSIISAVLILIFTMTLPFMREVFNIAVLPLSWLPFVFLWLFINVLIVEGAKLFFRAVRV